MIGCYTYEKNSIDAIRDWPYGTNWPSVYIIYNDSRAYVGQTLDLVSRTKQHLTEPEFDEFTDICLISNKTFNKSVALDLEAYLIKYMSADSAKELTNGNAGIVNHNYFYREAYEDDFKEIWAELLERGIVDNSISDIENSELFKYSPYKTLNNEQQEAAYSILKEISKVKDAGFKSIIKVTGGAGTGKTILAVYLVKLLNDISRDKKIWNAIDDTDASETLRTMVERIKGINRIGFVVPMGELRETMKKVFNSIDGLSEKMVLAPSEVVEENRQYDLLVVDEAHRLYKRYNLPGQHLYAKFDHVNERIMGSEFSKSASDYTELDWIIQSSRNQILFYDELQSIRAADIDQNRFNSICEPRLYSEYSLQSQMRCHGGTGYYDYVKKIIEGSGLTIHDYKKIENYQVNVVDSVEELFDLIDEKNTEHDYCRVVCGPGWSRDEKIIIEGKSYSWAEKMGDYKKGTIVSIHKSQGFDLNYAGVIFGKEIYYDVNNKQIEINKKELRDNHTQSSGDDAMRRFILNIYLTLMTRGIEGTFVYAVNPSLREYLKTFLN